jgi:Putative Ig domain
MTANLKVDGITLSDLAYRVSVDGANAKVRVDGVLVYEHIPVAAPDLSTSGAMPDGTQGAAYTYTPINTGGAATSWSAINLPSGVSINASTGVVSGTPVGTGSFTPTITATNTGGSDDFTDTISIAAALAAPDIDASSAMPRGFVGVAYTWSPTNTGGAATSYVLQAGTLPSGLSLNPSTGVISGTPTTIQTQSVTVRAINGAGTSDFTDDIEIARTLTNTLPATLEHASIGGLCEINFARQGSWSSVANTSGSPFGDYLNPTATAAGDAFEIYMATPTVITGTGSYTFAPGFNAWHTLNSNRNLQVDADDGQLYTITVDIQIREIAVPANIISKTIEMTMADLTPGP